MRRGRIDQRLLLLRYGERVGAIHFVVSNAAAAANVLSQVKIIVRTNYSSPPCHGARVAGAVLNDPELCTAPTTRAVFIGR
jgi:aspartate/tyrosine/aromatic aminotransferase